MDIKKAYYYIICLVSLFVLLWGLVDLSSAGVGIMTAKGPSLSAEPATEQAMDVYYQRKMLYDRLSDSLARFVIAGAVFLYSRRKINQLEK